MKQRSRHYKLSDTVFLRKIGNVVYVRNVATGEDFVFNEDAWPVLKSLQHGITQKSMVFLEQKDFVFDLCSFGIVNGNGDAGCQKIFSDPAVKRMSVPEECRNAGDGIAEKIQEECRNRHLLWSAGLELTYRCNERCKHCYIDVRSEQTTVGELTESEWLRTVDQLARMGCMKVLVTGGEPTVHPAFLSVCERIVKRGMLCDVYTNGMDISDNLFDSLKKLPLNSISVSLYSGASTFHDSITGVSGSFEKTFSNLLRFKNAGFDAYAKVPIFHNHLDDFFAAKKLGAQNGFRVLASTILVPGHSGATRNSMMMDQEEYRRFLNLEAKPDTSIESAVSLEKLREEPFCQAGQSTLCVSPSGDVMPCNSFPVVCGNVRQKTLSQIWRRSKFLIRLRKLRRRDASPRCAVCPDIAYCTVCPGASWKETNGDISPCSWSCEQTGVRASFNRNNGQKP